jgi:hypothetical protein
MVSYSSKTAASSLNDEKKAAYIIRSPPFFKEIFEKQLCFYAFNNVIKQQKNNKNKKS